jgi:hypothetical protein
MAFVSNSVWSSLIAIFFLFGCASQKGDSNQVEAQLGPQEAMSVATPQSASSAVVTNDAEAPRTNECSNGCQPFDLSLAEDDASGCGWRLPSNLSPADMCEPQITLKNGVEGARTTISVVVMSGSACGDVPAWFWDSSDLQLLHFCPSACTNARGLGADRAELNPCAL